MKKIKWIFLLLAIIIILNPVFSALASPLENYNQVTYVGGTSVNDDDGVKVSKIIEETELENYFNITLTVETTSKIEEVTKTQDLAVVLVLDISNTMNKNVIGDATLDSNNPNSRINVAKNSIKEFINSFYEYSENVNAVRQIGLVTFNRDASDVFDGLKEVNDVTVRDLINDVDEIKAPTDNAKKWTNMEAGLKKANELLNKSGVKNRYVIFLTDGLPTTYINNNVDGGFIGYTPYDHIGNSNDTYKDNEGKFYNFQVGIPVGSSGTNYSEWGARKAEMVAYSMKNNGVKIYSIGVGITSGQHTMYHLQYKENNKFANTVDTDTEANNCEYTSGMTYNKKRVYTVLPNVTEPISGKNFDNSKLALYDDTSYYKVWLSQYIGSDILDSSFDSKKYYYDSDKTDELESAYKKIFEDIKEMTSQEANASWVAKDPMNTTFSVNNIQFVGLYDDNDELKDFLDISNTYESDTASYSESDDSISWDLKNSTCEETIIDNVTYYKYEIKYKVRLENENSDFMVDTPYNTNGITYLDYIVLENKNGVNVRSELKNINFEIPSVLGYLGNLTFNKISNYNNMPLKDTEFILFHSPDCPCLKENKHLDKDYNKSVVSTEDGVVTLSNIPSGHKYKLKEVSTDSMHEVDSTIYDVDVSYGNVTTNIKDNKIVNKHKSKEFTIEKEVEGIDTDKEFNFELSISYNNLPLVGKYNITKNDSSDTIEFNDGKITFTLKDKDKITIHGLPLSISYNVKELNSSGFTIKYKINDNINIYDEDGLDGVLNDDTNILFINTSGYELPETGGMGGLILIIIGYLLLIGPIIYIGYDFYRKGKADFLK